MTGTTRWRAATAITTVGPFLLLLAAGCAVGDTDTKDSSTTDTSDTSDTTDTTDTTDTGPTATVIQACSPEFTPVIGTGTSAGATEGQPCVVGHAVATPESYTGTDELWLFPVDGYYVGDLACRITVTVTSTATRDDCAYGGVPCEWAFDMITSDATIEDPYGICLGTLGYDATTVSALNGVTLSRAFHSDYAGHAQVRLEPDDANDWRSVGYATWEAAGGAFSFGELDGDVIPLP